MVSRIQEQRPYMPKKPKSTSACAKIHEPEMESSQPLANAPNPETRTNNIELDFDPTGKIFSILFKKKLTIEHLR